MLVGWRGRAGFMMPSPAIASSEEMYMMCPEGVQAVMATYLIEEATIEGNRKALSYLETSVKQLAIAKVDAILHVGAMPSVVLGPDKDEEILRRAAEVTDIPMVLAMRATVEALHHLGVRTVAAVNPLLNEMVPLASRYLEAHGVRALSCPVLGLSSTIAVHELPSGAAYKLAIQSARQAPEADAILILGGGWRTLEVIDAIERDTGKPTLSTNTAAVWALLRKMGIQEPMQGFGRLLAE